MTAFTREQVRKFAPSAKAELVEALVAGSDLIEAAGITTPLRLQHFMAQIATETGGLKAIEENLNYTATRLRQVWPKRFPTLALAKQYERNPQKLANFVYGTRLGNKGGNDGWLYRGSGFLQTTGRDNFDAAGYAGNPDALRTPGPALTSALEYWTRTNCNSYADRDDVTGLRKRINGGTNGLAEAKTYLAKAKTVFKTVSETKAAPQLTRDQIAELQSKLSALGYTEVGTADGLVGAKTRTATARFQTANGLSASGVFDEKTVAALSAAKPAAKDR